MRFSISCAAATAAFALSACASTGGDTARVYDETSGEVVVMTVTRGEDGLLRDAQGNVVREARFVRNEGAISEQGDGSDIYCTRRHVVGTNMPQRVCMTRRQFITEREEAQQAWREGGSGHEPQTGGGFGSDSTE
ncbi:MAG: hypothetical protein KIS81_04950 [Maricaulaceae bacterium]|nr:hypothetical protein [Maricaulaceae bacterium]